MTKFILLSCIIILSGAAAQGLEVYHDPVDGKDYVADKWNRYTSQDNSSPKAITPASEKVSYERIRLLSTQSDFEEIGVNTLHDYTESVKNTLNNQVKKYGGAGQIITQVELSNNTNPKIMIAYHGKISEKLLQDFYDEVNKLAPLRTKTKTLIFQIILNIKE